MRTVLFVSIGALAALCPASAAAQAEQPASSVSITAPSQVAYGKHFTVRVKVTLPGPDDAYITGGFMDFGKTDPVPSKSKCPATPAGTFAADTPQSPQPAGLVSSTIRAHNSVKRTGTLRFCIWVIDAATGEQSASGAAYVKALAKKKRTRTHASARRVRAAAVRPAFKGQTSQLRHPIRLRIVSSNAPLPHIRDCVLYLRLQTPKPNPNPPPPHQTPGQEAPPAPPHPAPPHPPLPAHSSPFHHPKQHDPHQ